MKYATMLPPSRHMYYIVYTIICILVYWRENKGDRAQRCWNVKIPFALKWLNVTLFHAVLSRLSALFFGSGSPFFFFFCFRCCCCCWFFCLLVFAGLSNWPSGTLSISQMYSISISVCATLLALVFANQHAPNSLSIIWQFHWPGDNGIFCVSFNIFGFVTQMGLCGAAAQGVT